MNKGQTPEVSPECASKMRLVMRLTAGGSRVSGTRKERCQGAACIWMLASEVSDSHPRNGHSLQAHWYDREGRQGVWRSRIWWRGSLAVERQKAPAEEAVAKAEGPSWDWDHIEKDQ